MAVRIVLAAAAVLALLFASRIRLVLFYDADFRLEARFWFFHIPLPAGEKAAPKTGKKARARPKKQKPPKAGPKPDLSFFLRHFSAFFELAKKLIAAAGRRLTVERFELDLRIHEEDAADTAIRYGQACAAVYTALGFLHSAVRVKRERVRISPLFSGGETAVSFQAELSMRIFAVLTLLVSQGIPAARTFFSLLRAEDEERPGQTPETARRAG